MFLVTFILGGLCTSLCASSALHPCQAYGKNTPSSAPAQHCIHARHMVTTPASTASMPGKCQAYGNNTRPSALAQHCIHARQMVRTPARARPLNTVSMPGKWYEHPLKRTRSALHPCQANGKRTRSNAPTQHCMHARHMMKTPA